MRRSFRRPGHARWVIVAALLAATPVIAATSGRMSRYRHFDHSLRFRDAALLSGGGAVAVGYSRADADPAATDAVVAEFRANGDLERLRTFDMGAEAELIGVAATIDGGWVAAGYAPSATGTKAAWLVRVDAIGTTQWSRLLPSAPTSELQDVVVSSTGLIVVGMQGAAGWIAGLGPDGIPSWGWTFPGVTHFRHVVMEPGGDLIAVGRARTPSGDDAFTVRLSSSGLVVDQDNFDVGSNADSGDAVAALADGGTAVGGFVGWTNQPFVVRTTRTGEVAWRREWGDGGALHDIQEDADGTLVVVGSIGSHVWLSRLDPAGEEIDRLYLQTYETIWGAAWLPSRTLMAVGASGQALVLLVPPDWSRLRACSVALPPVGSDYDVTTRTDGTVVPVALSPMPADLVPIVAQIDPVVTTIVCPDPPAEPVPIFVGKANPDVVIEFGEPANASSYGIYEGPIGSFRPPSLFRCHAAPGDPGVTRAPDGSVHVVHGPATEDAWFLVTGTNEAGESALGRGSDGPLDVPSSTWRCGASR